MLKLMRRADGKAISIWVHIPWELMAIDMIHGLIAEKMKKSF